MKNLSLFIIVLFYAHFGITQCLVTIDSPVTPIDCDDCFTLTANGYVGSVLLSLDFNNSSLSPSWSVTAFLNYNNPCGAPLDGSIAGWFGTGSTAPRILISPSADVSSGGHVCWEMKYATNGGFGNCEGPDSPNEGVSLQYSINGGTIWINIQTWPPNGGTDPFLTQWQNYCVAIPVAAQTTNTKFRWIQDNSSGGLFDNWGLDNIVVSSPINNQGYYYDWFEDGTSNSADTILCQNSSIEDYNVIYTNGIDDTCSATITMAVDSSLLIADFSFDKDTVCIGEILAVDGSNLASATSYNWTFNGGTPNTNTGVNSTTTFNNLGTYWVVLEVMNTCGITDIDSLEVIVLSIPNIALSASDSTICPNGSSNLSATGASSYIWSPAASLSCSNCQSPVATPLSTITYDVIGSNGICFSPIESITIEVDIPPLIADFILVDDTVCIGDIIDFNCSTSIGAESYEWTFSGATPLTSSGENVTTMYFTAGTHEVQLVVKNECNVTDTLIKSIVVIPQIDCVNSLIETENESMKIY